MVGTFELRVRRFFDVWLVCYSSQLDRPSFRLSEINIDNGGRLPSLIE